MRLLEHIFYFLFILATTIIIMLDMNTPILRVLFIPLLTITALNTVRMGEK